MADVARRTLDGWGYSPLDQIDRDNTSGDDYVFALDAATGELAWETQILDYRVNPANQRSGPIVADGKIVSGRGCTPRGGPNACFIVLHDATTGEELWRRRTTAAPSSSRLSAGRAGFPARPRLPAAPAQPGFAVPAPALALPITDALALVRIRARRSLVLQVVGMARLALLRILLAVPFALPVTDALALLRIRARRSLVFQVASEDAIVLLRIPVGRTVPLALALADALALVRILARLALVLAMVFKDALALLRIRARFTPSLEDDRKASTAQFPVPVAGSPATGAEALGAVLGKVGDLTLAFGVRVEHCSSPTAPPHPVAQAEGRPGRKKGRDRSPARGEKKGGTEAPPLGSRRRPGPYVSPVKSSIVRLIPEFSVTTTTPPA